MDLTVKNCSFNYEKNDGRYALFLDDVVGARISEVRTVPPGSNKEVIKLKNSPQVHMENISYHLP
jgi:hypothetical protein